NERWLASTTGACLGYHHLFADVDGDGVANVIRHDPVAGTWKYLVYDVELGVPDRWPGTWMDLELGPKVPSVSGGPSGVRLGALAPAVYLGTQGQEEPLAIRSFNLNGDNLPDFIEHRL